MQGVLTTYYSIKEISRGALLLPLLPAKQKDQYSGIKEKTSLPSPPSYFPRKAKKSVAHTGFDPATSG